MLSKSRRGMHTGRKREGEKKTERNKDREKKKSEESASAQLVPRKSMCVANESCGVQLVGLIYVVSLLDEPPAGAADRPNG